MCKNTFKVKKKTNFVLSSTLIYTHTYKQQNKNFTFHKKIIKSVQSQPIVRELLVEKATECSDKGSDCEEKSLVWGSVKELKVSAESEDLALTPFPSVALYGSLTNTEFIGVLSCFRAFGESTKGAVLTLVSSTSEALVHTA